MPGASVHGHCAPPDSTAAGGSTDLLPGRRRGASRICSRSPPESNPDHSPSRYSWREADRRTASIGNPAVLGVADRAIRLLSAAARSPADIALATSRALREELIALWSDDDALSTRVSGFDDGIDGAFDDDIDDDIATASAHRARCLELGQRSTTALLAATGGAGMDLRHSAQRLAREALFYVIQAQTNDGRSATLEHQQR